MSDSILWLLLLVELLSWWLLLLILLLFVFSDIGVMQTLYRLYQFFLKRSDLSIRVGRVRVNSLL